MKLPMIFVLSGFLWAGNLFPLSAENWMAVSPSSSLQVDTDSISQKGPVTTLSIRTGKGAGSFISSISFDQDHRSWCIHASGRSPSSSSFQKIRRGTQGETLFRTYVENPIPDITSIIWVPVDKNNTKYAIDRKGMRYRDGYADFWLYAKSSEAPVAYVVYHLKMNMAYNRIKTLSATGYDGENRIVSHLPGASSWEPIPPHTILEDIFLSIKKELVQGSLK